MSKKRCDSCGAPPTESKNCEHCGTWDGVTKEPKPVPGFASQQYDYWNPHDAPNLFSPQGHNPFVNPYSSWAPAPFGKAGPFR